MPQTLNVQAVIDEYIDLNKRSKEIAERMKTLRALLEPCFGSGHTELHGTNGGKITAQVSSRPVMNANYTSYELSDLMEYLTPRLKNLVVEERVSEKLLKATVDLGKLPTDVLALKRVTPITSLVVKK